MKNRHLLTSSLFLLLILLSATRGNAGTGSCADDPATSCNDTNTCNGATDCAIYISLDDTNRVVVSLQRSGTHRSEEHTSELQSLRHLVCRLLLEKKKE